MGNPIKTRALRGENDGATDLLPWHERYLLHGEDPDRGTPGCNFFQFWEWKHRGGCKETWAEHRERLLKAWIRERPGSRPWAWWEFDAPQEPLVGWDPAHWRVKYGAIRARLGGTGTPAYVLPGGEDDFTRGIPDVFISEFDIQEFEAWDVDRGEDLPERSTLNISEPLELIDPRDPPRYEPETAYLERLGLLAPGERERIPAEAFEPEAVLPNPEEDGEAP